MAEHETLFIVTRIAVASRLVKGSWVFRTRQAATQFKRDSTSKMKIGSGYKYSMTKAHWGPEQ